ncbi:MAG: TIR domain-containing protein [Verrucomicrobia bacterium]|nr:TIR domain-containing protein [Verrucomicrobiota bacterium]
MPDPASRAVFLSYAREDTDAARRIADALHAFGVEVWFDQSELRGGDAWDQKIRKQIKECALFMPIISARTQGRQEGYFRLEWELAEERTHLMVRGAPFVVPMVIDETTEAEALVPDRFRDVQWTRLPGALPTPEFVARVRQLLESPRATAVAVGQVSDLPHQGAVARHERSYRTQWVWATAVLATVAVAGVVFQWRRSVPQPPPAVASSSSSSTAAQPPMDFAAAKSIAVLPFVNRSADSGDAFFTDGMHEDILTNLARIRELQVTSRTSVEQYRATTKPMLQIGRELAVAYILEGSVQRAGSTVRITGQLIDARTDKHLWAQSFDRELSTTNIFAIQSELAQAIARELKAAISPEEKKLLARRPTENLAAYELFLKARAEKYRGIRTSAALDQLEILYQAPVDLDPNFALAWSEISWVHGYKHFFRFDHTSVRIAKAKTAIDIAVRLAPDAPETILNLGYFHYFCGREYSAALEQFERLVGQQPNDGAAVYALGLIQHRTAKWRPALENFRKATELEPTLPARWGTLSRVLLAGRRFDEAAAANRRTVELSRDELGYSFNLAAIPFFARGATREMEMFLGGLPPDKANSPAGLDYRRTWAVGTGDSTEAMRLDQLQPGSSNAQQAVMMAAVYAAKGDAAAARARLENIPPGLRSRLERESDHAALWGTLGRMEAILGNKAEALRCARKAVELVPESLDSLEGPRFAADLAFVYAWTGDRDRAIAEYTRLLRTPWYPGQNVQEMKRSPVYAPLRGDPRFEALLNDPKNNAPLF